MDSLGTADLRLAFAELTPILPASAKTYASGSFVGAFEALW